MEYTNYQHNNPEKDILSDIEFHLVPASTAKRFGNYIIDLISFYAVIIIIAFVLAIFLPSIFDNLDNEDSGVGLIQNLLGLILFGMYMGVVEGLFNGRTLGKLITGTVAVNEDGSKISWSTAFKRGFTRIVPFEPFSGLSGYPWHDKWTQTLVIDRNLSMRDPQ